MHILVQPSQTLVQVRKTDGMKFLHLNLLVAWPASEVLLLMGRGLTGFFMGFNTNTIRWLKTGDTMKRVGAGWVDDTDRLGRVGTLW